MFSVLIVDDEEPVLDSYEFMINAFPEVAEKKSPFSLAGKARTGYEALRLINEKSPDIVFMDINIPGIDGLEVLEDVYKKYPRMLCILSTAYERFDLARRAIPLGVFAYLVKPVSKKAFFSTLENALARLNSQVPLSSEYNDPRLALFRRDIWTIMDEQRWQWYRENLNLPSDRALVLMVEAEQGMEKFGALIAEQLSFKYHCIYDCLLNRGIFLVSEDIDAASFRRAVIKILEKHLGGVAWYYGIGGSSPGKELCHSCEEALAELNAKRRETDAWGLAGKKIAHLRQKFGFLPMEETRALFSSIWEPLFSGDFNAAKIRMVSFFTLLLDDLYGYWSSPSQKTDGIIPAAPPFDPAEIMELPDIGAWKLWADRNFQKLTLQANMERQENFPQPLLKALRFIRENYCRAIQLSDAAEAARVNTAYLSRLFANHLKTNFIDYLTALRIGEAERLLKEKSISVKEAAIATGYQDPNYFSKIFKKLKGKLPTEVIKEDTSFH